MGEFIDVSKTDELRDGTMRAVSAVGREILLARVGDKYYAVDGRCPHMKGGFIAGQTGRDCSHLSPAWFSI